MTGGEEISSGILFQWYGQLILVSAVTDSEVGLWTKSSLQTGMVVVNQEFLSIIRGSGTEMKLVKPKQFAF